MSEPQAPVANIAQDWAGLTKQGRVLISIDRVKAGHPLAEIIAHERAHAVLIRNSEFGWVMNTLASLGLHPWPPGETRERCHGLLNVLTNACQWTQEGLATFVAGLPVNDRDYERYRERQPALYRRAASQLEWLRGRRLDPQAQAEVAVILACLASGPPLLERWGRDQLTDVSRARAWFDQPANRPDARFPVVCRALSALTNAELVRLTEDAAAAQAAAYRHVRISGVKLDFRLLPDDTPLDGVKRIVREVIAPLLDDSHIPAHERQRLAEVAREPLLAVRGLAPSKMAILMARTRGAVGRFLRDPSPQDLAGYDLVTVQYNASFEAEPGLTPSGREPMPLLPREAVCYFSGPQRSPLAAIFSASAFRAWLDALDESVTLAVYDTSYLALGLPVPDLPALIRRRHVVLVNGRTPYDLVLDVVSSLDPRATALVTVNASDLVGVSYVILRREDAPSPALLLPTAADTARETVSMLTSHRQGPRFRLVPPEQFFFTREALEDVMRVIADFEAD